MPTGVLHLKEVDTDEITLDGTLSVSGASTLEGATVTNSTLSVGGAATLADTNAVNVNVSGTLSVGGQTTISGDIIPDTNDAYDIGSPEFKIRDMYVSDNSLWIGDTTKISNVGGRLKFRKRKTDATPQAVVNAGLNAGYANETATTNAALSHAGVSDLSQMRLQHWHKFMLLFNPQAKLTDIFRDTDDDYEETSASDAWKEINETKIYTDTNVGIGTSDPEAALHIRGAVKVENGFSLARNEGNDPSVIIDTKNFGLDETVNDLTGSGFNKYTKLYRVYGTNSQGVGKNWYWGYAQDDYTKFSLSFDGAGGNDPDIAFVFTTASELHCNKVYAALSGNADTATKLQTARKINGVDFDGTADITIPMSTQDKIQIGPLDNDHLYLASSNVAYGWTLDTVDQGNGSVPFRITKRHGGVDTTVLTIKNENGYMGISQTNPQTKLHVYNSDDSTGTGDAFIPGLIANTSNRKPTECLRLQGHWRSPGSGALLRFTNYHGGGANPNSNEYNTAGIAGFDYDNNWGGGLCFYTSPNGTTGGGDLTARMIIDSAGDVQVENRLKLSGTKALQQNKRFKYNITASGNNNHTLQIPITGSTAQGVMFAKVSAVQVAANGSGNDYRMVEGWLNAYHNTGGIALKATRAIDGQNFYVYHVTEAHKSTGTLYIQYRPSQGFNQNVSITFDVELVLGGTFSTAGVLSHHYENTNVGLALHSADTGRSCFNFRYNPPAWGYASTHTNWGEANLFSFTLNVPYDGWVYLKCQGHWAKKSGNYHLGGNDGFYAWVSMDNNDASAGSLVDHDYTPSHHASVYAQDRFHEYNSPDAAGAGYWRDLNHNNWYKVTAGNRQFSLRIGHNWNQLMIHGATIAGFYIPRTDL